MSTALPQLLEYLRTPDGRALMAEAEAAGQDTASRALALRKRHPELSAEAAAVVAAQPELRRRAEAKFPYARNLFFLREPLEMATARPLALHRAKRFRRCRQCLDLCAGLGGDTIAIAHVAETVTAVESDPATAACLAANVDTLGLDVEVVLAPAEEFVGGCGRFDAVMFDPARRADGRRSRDPLRTWPPFDLWRDILTISDRLAVKLSPTVEPDSLPPGCDVELVSYRGECRELVAWFGAWSENMLRATCVTGEDGRSIGLEHPRSQPLPRPPVADAPDAYIYEPDPALVRSGLMTVVAERHGLALLDPEIAYLTSANRVESPFLKAFRVLHAESYNEKRLKRRLREAAIGELTVRRRGFPEPPERVLKRLEPAGPNAATLILTRIGRRHVYVLAEPEK